MDIQKIKELTNEWELATDEVIEFKNVEHTKVRNLFKETLDILDKYRGDKLVPKEISDLLLKLNNFGWWVSDLEETPLHYSYQVIVSLIFDLNEYFLTCKTDPNVIKDTIEKIN